MKILKIPNLPIPAIEELVSEYTIFMAAIISPTETLDGAASVAMGTDVSTNQIPESLPATKRKGIL